MKKVTIERTETTFLLPADDIRAAWPTVSTEQTRYYLQGVYVERGESGEVTLVSTDGHALIKIDGAPMFHLGTECTTQECSGRTGMILKLDPTEKAFKAKATGDLWVYGDIKTGILQFLDVTGDLPAEGGAYERLGVCEFERIDGTFPDWTRVMPPENETCGAPAFNPDVLAKFTKARAVYKARRRVGAMRLTTSGETGAPIKVEIADCPRFTGVLMPMKF